MTIFIKIIIIKNLTKMVKKSWKSVDVNFSIKSLELSKERNIDDQVSTDIGSIRQMLPTTTNASRIFDDIEKIPTEGPFLLSFSNVSFEVDIEGIRSFFKSFSIVDISMNQHRRGSGTIEFSDVENLKSALELNGQRFVGRIIQLNVITKPTVHESNGKKMPNRKYNNENSDNKATGADCDNWRTQKHLPAIEKVSLASDCDNWRRSKPASELVDNKKDVNCDNWRRLNPVSESMDNKKDIHCDNWRVKKHSSIAESETGSANNDNWRKSKPLIESTDMNKPVNCDGNWSGRKPLTTVEGQRNSSNCDNWRNKKQSPPQQQDSDNWRCKSKVVSQMEPKDCNSRSSRGQRRNEENSNSNKMGKEESNSWRRKPN